MSDKKYCYFFATRLNKSAYTDTMQQSAYELDRRGHTVILLPGGGKQELTNAESKRNWLKNSGDCCQTER